MPYFKIYAGLSGGFGGANYIGTYEFNSQDEALEEARDHACEEYASYAGYHGLRDFDDIIQDLVDEGYDPEDIDEAEVEQIYDEECDSWIDYDAVETDSLDDTDE